MVDQWPYLPATDAVSNLLKKHKVHFAVLESSGPPRSPVLGGVGADHYTDHFPFLFCPLCS